MQNYAVQISLGRTYAEEPAKYRTEFQRDRDRVIHSSAFRRLEYKTQVFINHEGDLFRTRLTHSLEVAQIGRAVALALGLNVDLVEAICLAHDLGHTPFGHIGQEELNRCLLQCGEDGFEHNLQSLRIVEYLERSYPEFDGLNLTFEAKEGILKHCSPKKASQLGELGVRFLHNKQPSLEAQLSNIADELAYNYHDIDDGLRSGLITLEELERVRVVKENLEIVRSKYPNLEGRRLHKELVRHLIGVTIEDLVESSLSNIKNYQLDSVAEVRGAPIVVKYSEAMAKKQSELKKFLHKNLYQHHQVMQLRFKAAMVIRSLFEVYSKDSLLLPYEYQKSIDTDGIYRVVADYISGMTDRYAFRQYNQLFLVDAV